MIWPWVSQERLLAAERAAAAWKAAHDALVPLLAIKDQKHDALLEKYHELACPPKSVAPVALNPEREPSLVKRAIREQSLGDARLEAHFRRHAQELKAKGMKDEEIAAELSTWSTTEDLYIPPVEVVKDA